MIAGVCQEHHCRGSGGVLWDIQGTFYLLNRLLETDCVAGWFSDFGLLGIGQYAIGICGASPSGNHTVALVLVYHHYTADMNRSITSYVRILERVARGAALAPIDVDTFWERYVPCVLVGMSE